MKYKVGDKVVIRQWADMEKEFGTSVTGRIKVHTGLFFHGMEKHCGAVMTVLCVNDLSYKMYEDDAYWNWSDEMIERRVDMTKSDLKSGMVVEMRDGDRLLAVSKDGFLSLMSLDGTNYLHIDDRMKDDMTFSEHLASCDIMKVYEPESTLNRCKNTTSVIWERKEPKEMTMAELEKTLGYPIKIVKEDKSC